MSRLKTLLHRRKKSSQNDQSGDENKNTEEKRAPDKPTRGWRRLIAIYKIYSPLGIYQRALKWNLSQTKCEEVINVNTDETRVHEVKTIMIEEKTFRSRFSYFIGRTFLQSIGLSIVFTAPLSLPWFFNVIIPFTIDLIPFGLNEIIRDIINTLLSLLKPFEIVPEFIMNLSNIFGSANPLFLYGATLFFLSVLGIIPQDLEEIFKSIETNGNEGGSIVALIANNYQTKFSQFVAIIIPLLFVCSGIVAFFLIFRRAKTVIFELQSDKGEQKNIRKYKSTLLSYYLDDGVTNVIYMKNRLSNSKKLRWIRLIAEWGPLISVVLPISLALIYLFV